MKGKEDDVENIQQSVCLALSQRIQSAYYHYVHAKTRLAATLMSQGPFCYSFCFLLSLFSIKF